MQNLLTQCRGSRAFRRGGAKQLPFLPQSIHGTRGNVSLTEVSWDLADDWRPTRNSQLPSADFDGGVSWLVAPHPISSPIRKPELSSESLQSLSKHPIAPHWKRNRIFGGRHKPGKDQDKNWLGNLHITLTKVRPNALQQTLLNSGNITQLRFGSAQPDVQRFTITTLLLHTHLTIAYLHKLMS